MLPFNSFNSYVGLSGIAGLDKVKQSLREAIIYPTKYPQLFKSNCIFSSLSI